MDSEIVKLYKKSGDYILEIVRGVKDDQWDLPTINEDSIKVTSKNILYGVILNEVTLSDFKNLMMDEKTFIKVIQVKQFQLKELIVTIQSSLIEQHESDGYNSNNDEEKEEHVTKRIKRLVTNGTTD